VFRLSIQPDSPRAAVVGPTLTGPKKIATLRLFPDGRRKYNCASMSRRQATSLEAETCHRNHGMHVQVS
jgi:hypothetical protein